MKEDLPGTAAETPVGQIDALTSTRAVAAILVFIHHFGPAELFSPHRRVGNVAVGYFFVLSGFVLYLAYSGRRASYGNYLRRRVARIVPVYLLALLLILFPAEQGFRCVIDNWRTLKEALLGAALLQAYIPTYPLTLNLPAWTISVEMFFYLLFPLILRREQRSFRSFAVAAAILFVASQAVHLYVYPVRQQMSETVTDLVFFSPFIHLSQFLLGMISGYIFIRHRHRLPKQPLLPLLLLTFCIAAVALRGRFPQYISFQVGLLAPLFMLLILSIAVRNPPLLRARPLVFLGEISYGIYILQWPFYMFIGAFNRDYWKLDPRLFFVIALCGLILFASIVYYLFELPMKRLINGPSMERRLS